MIIEKYEDQAEIKRLLITYTDLMSLLIDFGYINGEEAETALENVESAKKYIKMLGE